MFNILGEIFSNGILTAYLMFKIAHVISLPIINSLIFIVKITLKDTHIKLLILLVIGWDGDVFIFEGIFKMRLFLFQHIVLIIIHSSTMFLTRNVGIRFVQFQVYLLMHNNVVWTLMSIVLKNEVMIPLFTQILRHLQAETKLFKTLNIIS